MPNEEWEKVKEALKKPATPEAMEEASQAFKQWRATKKGRGSRPTLVSLGLRKPYPTAIEVKDIAKELETNPAFFDHLREIIEEGD